MYAAIEKGGVEITASPRFAGESPQSDDSSSEFSSRVMITAHRECVSVSMIWRPGGEGKRGGGGARALEATQIHENFHPHCMLI